MRAQGPAGSGQGQWRGEAPTLQAVWVCMHSRRPPWGLMARSSFLSRSPNVVSRPRPDQAEGSLPQLDTKALKAGALQACAR